MNHFWEVLIPVVFVFVWILQHLMRGKEEDQPRRTRQAGSGERPARRQASEIDRFLEEVNRRRRQAEERRQVAPQAPAPTIPTVVPARPAVRPPRPARPPATVVGSAPPSVRPSARRPAASPRVPSREVPVAVEVAAAAVPRAELPEVVAVEVSEVPAAPSVSSAQPPSLFSGLLDKPQNIRDALVWREILSPPRCRHYGLREFYS
jgi:hypothetical protein